MRRALAVLAVVVALPLASCSGGGGDTDRYLLTLEGSAELDDGTTLEAGEHRLEVGDLVRITDGSATLGLPGDRSLELRAGDDPGDDSRVEVDVEPTLVDGHALLLTGDGETARLHAGDATVALRGGAARIRRSTGVSAAVYAGQVEVESLGQSLDAPVRALRQVTVAGTGALPRRSSPLVFDRDDLDPWDRRYLGPAVELGEQLDRMSLALSRRLEPPSPTDAAYFRSVVPALRPVPEFGPELLASRASSAPGEMVVGAAVVLGGDGPFVERWSDAWAFRDDGADWGLVALDQQAARDEVIGALGGILDAVVESIDLAGGPFGDGAVDEVALPSGPAPVEGETTAPAPGRGDEGDVPAPRPSPVPVPTPTVPTLPPLLPSIPPLLPGGDDDPGGDGGGDGGDEGVLPPVPQPSIPEPVGGLLEPVTDPVVGVVDDVVDVVDGLLGPVLGPVTGPLLG